MSVMHVARIGTDLIYATSYDKPQDYVDELLAEVGRLVMREVSARACDGGATPRYALDVARERSHSAKHPLMVRGYLASSKAEQSGGRAHLACRKQSDRDSRRTPSGTLPSGQKLLFYRPEGRCRTLGHQAGSATFSRLPVTRAAWESCSANVTDGMHCSSDASSTEGCNKTNKATLLRSRSSESSVWDAQLERLPKSQRVSERCRHQAKDSHLKLKLMNRDFARSAETLHGFLVGAQYNRSRGVVEAVTAGLRTESDEYQQATEATTDRLASSANYAGEASKRKVRPFSAVPESNAWSQQHTDSPPLYARPYSSIAGCVRRPAAERPLSALQKAITIRQLPSSSSHSQTSQSGLKSKAQRVPSGILKNCPSASTEHSLHQSWSPMKVTGLNQLQIVSQRVVQHVHTRTGTTNVEQHHSEIRSGDSAVGTPVRIHQTTKESLALPERPSVGLQSDDASEMCIDGQGFRQRNTEPYRALVSNLFAGFEIDSVGLTCSSALALGDIREAEGLPTGGCIGAAAAAPMRSQPELGDRPSKNGTVSDEVGDTVEDTAPGGSRLSIHVDVVMLHEDEERSHASDKSDANNLYEERSRASDKSDANNLYADIAADQ